MTKVTIHAAKTNLSKLVARAEAGEEILIYRGATLAAKLVPANDAKALPDRKPGSLKGIIEFDDRFFDPLPDHMMLKPTKKKAEVKLLLDTHAYIWWTTDDRRLSAKARKAIAARAAEIFVSAATAYEMTFKHRSGALPKVGQLVMNLDEDIATRGFIPLPISMEHGRRAGELPDDHGDPFDRILAAQAIVEGMPIVSNDEKLSALGAKRVW